MKMEREVLYPPVCRKCGVPVSTERKVRTRTNNVGEIIDIWIEHDFDCAAAKKQLDKLQPQTNQP